MPRNELLRCDGPRCAESDVTIYVVEKAGDKRREVLLCEQHAQPMEKLLAIGTVVTPHARRSASEGTSPARLRSLRRA